ncbi:MAG: MFS transporter [Microthrixaceae bacterium]
MTRVRLAAGETFASLRNRNFRLFFVGQTISQVGNWLTLITQTLLVLNLTHSGTALGMLTAAQFAPVLVLGPFAGLVADRSDKRRLLVITQALAMLQSFALAAVAVLDRPPVSAIFAIALVGGVVTAFDNPARRSFVVEMVPVEQVNNAVSLNSALMTGSRVVGPALAGLLVVTVGFAWTFAADGISYVAVIAGLVMMRSSELRPAPIVEKAKGQVREGIAYARSMPVLWVPLVMMAIVGTFAFNFSVTFPVFVTRTLHGTESTFTILFSWLSVGSLLGALAVARRPATSVRFVALSSVAFGVSMVGAAIAPSEAVVFVIAPIVGAASIAFMTSSTAIVQTESDPSMRGRVLALQSMVFLGSTPIGGPIVGWVTEHLGARFGLGLGAVACLAAGAWGVATVRNGATPQPQPPTGDTSAVLAAST